jgi:hypothetical protein
LILTGGGGRDGLQAIAMCMSVLDLFLAEHPDLRSRGHLLKVTLWTAHFWPNDEMYTALTCKIKGKSFVDAYVQETGIHIDIRLFALRESDVSYGVRMMELRQELRKCYAEVAGVIFMESGADALIDLKAVFRVDAVDDAMQLYTLMEELHPEVAMVYVQTNVGVDFRAFPEAQMFHSLSGTAVAETEYCLLDAEKQWKQAKSDLRAGSLEGGRSFAGIRMAAFVFHFAQVGLPMNFPEAAKLDFCRFIGAPSSAQMSYFVGTLSRRPPQMTTWLQMHAVLPRLRASTATYSDLLAALAIVRLKAAPQPPQPPAPEPPGRDFSERLLAQMELAWLTYRRLVDEAADIRCLLADSSRILAFADTLKSVGSASIRSGSTRMPHTHFLTQRDATCFDIIFWMLWAADDGEATIRALLPWAGVPPGVATDEAVESLQISVSRGAGGRTKFAVGQQFVAPITGEVMLAYQALADALLASIAKTS